MRVGSLEELLIEVFNWCGSHQGSVALAADDPSGRTIGYSCFVVADHATQRDENRQASASELFEISVEDAWILDPERGCSFWKKRVIEPKHRRELTKYFLTPDGRKQFEQHLDSCPVCLPVYVMLI